MKTEKEIEKLNHYGWSKDGMKENPGIPKEDAFVLRKDILAIKNKVSDNWVYIKDDLPPTGTMVDGYNEKWVDEDFNPEGIRECFLHAEGFWDCAKWDNDQDCWDTINDIPSHWKQRFSPVDSSWQWTDSLVKEMIYSKLPIPDHYSGNIQRCLDEFKKYKTDDQ